MEMKDCTFTPNLKKQFPEGEGDRVFERLYKETVKDYAKLEQEKLLSELKDCTFSPSILPKKLNKS